MPESRGLTADVVDHARTVPFNDTAALERVLGHGAVALVLANRR